MGGLLAGSRTPALSGELADGTVLTGGSTPDQVRAAVAAIDSGRAAAGRTDPHRVTVFVPVATGDDAAARLAAEAAGRGFAPGADIGGEPGLVRWTAA